MKLTKLFAILCAAITVCASIFVVTFASIHILAADGPVLPVDILCIIALVTIGVTVSYCVLDSLKKWVLDD